MTFPLHPLEDSDDGMHRYLHFVLKDKKNDFLGVLTPDEDSMPCVHRVWKVEPFDDELVDLAAKAWLRLGETVNQVVQWMGTTPQELSLSCRHSGQRVQFKLFDRDKLNAQLREMRREARVKSRPKSDA
jgi:hypothetical protein